MEPTQQELATFAGQFLERVQLQGAEVPAFTAVMNWLQGISTATEERQTL